MKKDSLLKELKTLVKTNVLYTSLILNGKSQTEIEGLIDEIIRMMVCLNQSDEDDQCLFCRKTLKHNLVDVFYLGDGINQISKEEVKVMMDKLTLSALEAHGQKFYVIRNAENLKLSAANALLKFLEEPPAKTYAFLLTKDRSLILPTIKSRCKLFVVENEVANTPKTEFEKVLESRNKETYLLASHKFKKIDKTALIRDLEDAYQRLIVHQFPEFCQDTLILINDLKTLPNQNLAIDHYFIKIAERLNEN